MILAVTWVSTSEGNAHSGAVFDEPLWEHHAVQNEFFTRPVLWPDLTELIKHIWLKQR